jgi:hypothetical protein
LKDGAKPYRHTELYIVPHKELSTLNYFLFYVAQSPQCLVSQVYGSLIFCFMCRVPRLGLLLGLNQMAKSQQQFADNKVDLKGDDDQHDDDINNLEVRESST